MVFQYLRTRGKSLFTESVHQQATSILSNIGTLGKSEHICDWFGTFIDPQCSQILAPWESLNIFAIGLELLTSDGCIWEGLKSMINSILREYLVRFREYHTDVIYRIACTILMWSIGLGIPYWCDLQDCLNTILMSAKVYWSPHR